MFKKMILMFLVTFSLTITVNAQTQALESFRVEIADSLSSNHPVMQLYKKMIRFGNPRLYEAGFNSKVTAILGEYDIVATSLSLPDNMSRYSVDLLVDTGQRVYAVVATKPSGQWGGGDLLYVPTLEVNGTLVPDKDAVTQLTESIKNGKWYLVIQGIDQDFRVNLGILYKK